jgi:hypothetical protein
MVCLRQNSLFGWHWRLARQWNQGAFSESALADKPSVPPARLHEHIQ